MSSASWRKNFYILWSGQGFSILTSSICQWALIFYLTISTNSGAVLSLTTLSSILPGIFLGPIAGLIVDRLPRKVVLIGADTFVGIMSIPLIVDAFNGTLNVWMICLILFLRSAGSAFHMPAIQATTPQIVPKDHLMEVGGYSGAIQNFGYIAGTVSAAILYPIFPLWFIISLDLIGVAVGASCVALIKLKPVPQAEARKHKHLIAHIWHENVLAYRAIRHTRGFSEMFITLFLYLVVFSPLFALYPLMTLQYFQGSKLDASIVEACYAIGMIFGGFLLGRFLSKANRGWLMALSASANGIITFCMGILRPNMIFIFMLLNLAAGVAEMFYTTPLDTLPQERIHGEMLGRVFSLGGTIRSLAMSVGLVLSGLFSDVLGLNNFFMLSGISILLVGSSFFLLPNLLHIEKFAEPEAQTNE